MSNSRDWKVINKAEESVVVAFGSICRPVTPNRGSAIDEYYLHTQALLTKSALPDVQADGVLTRLLVLELTSTTETYFRRVLASLVALCPVCRRHASLKQLSLGSVDYYSPESLGHGLLEGISLSGAKEVQTQTASLTGVSIDPKSSVGVALVGFGKVCHLRHAVVHARGALGSQNVAELGVGIRAPCEVAVDTLSFQALVALCHSTIRAYNRFIFQRVVDRWIAETILTGLWSDDKRFFEPLHRLFYSQVDALGASRAYQAYRVLQPAVLSRLK